MVDGKAHFQDQPKGLGEQSYEVEIKLKDHKTGKIKSIKRKFFYQVVAPFVQISHDSPKPKLHAQAQLSNGRSEGKIKASHIRLQDRVLASIDNQEVNTQVNIQSFELTYTPVGGQPIQLKNMGGKFQKEVLNIIKKAKAGDLFLFHNIRANYIGQDDQLLNSMGFIVN